MKQGKPSFRDEVRMESEKQKPVLGYTSPEVCLDGTNSHEWVEDVMPEEGVDYPIIKCTKCGYWGSR